ncbi:putative RtcB-like protein [Ralstonia phage RP31]|uniref:3'-phosphate/5'-hydroxy nucleic acid ligase n=2 Tax=Ripduovirus RP12 TaxID=2560700 RepID=A0A1L7N133_9CAUD|nr:tRNA splicing ligase [Ralstonia phage RP12]BAW19187.1 putative RtcB-like protein [Ralstonia phage RP12]BAW19473.1 putative RtcB-like protein [Ralstonia phage RP31]
MQEQVQKTFELIGGEPEAGSKPIKGWTVGVPVEADAVKQLKNIASLPFIHSHVAVMPDVHLGIGATVGSVIATKGAVVPAAVGVDLGCGMSAQRLRFSSDALPESLSHLRDAIERAVPHGRTDNGGSRDKGAWGVVKIFDHPVQAVREEADALRVQLNAIIHKHPKLARAAQRAWNHIGTLGTGNHFIEICLDESDRVWVMLHSGSRGIGNAIGSYFIDKAKEEMARFFIHLPDQDLAYLPHGSLYYDDYIQAVSWAQRFAALNRTVMMHATLNAIHQTLGLPIDSDLEAINCHHNYVSTERHFGQNVLVTRKGAVNASLDTLGIIPGSMGAKSFIVRGKGNRESFCSCSHGAGRVMSRNQAKKLFTLEDHIRDTAGVECRKDSEVIDETPKAYKNIDDVMSAQEELVDIEHTLKQILCVKG